MASVFWEHAVHSALPTLKVCMLGAVGVLLAKTVSRMAAARQYSSALAACPCVHMWASPSS